MSLKLKAALYTAALLSGIAFLAIALEFITRELTADQIITIVGGGMCAWFVYIIYAIMVSRLEYEETLKNIK